MITRAPQTGQALAVTIDGEQVFVPAGSTVLQAIRLAGKDVPTLCHSDSLKPYGACRVCTVEVVGGKPVASCHTPAAAGASYLTRSNFLSRLRRNIVELIVSDHPLECLTCSANQRCDLQKLAGEVGLRVPRYENPRQHHPKPDDSHPFIKLEMDKCIGCGRCVRACDEVQGSFVLGMQGRGYDVKVIAGNDTGMEEAGCVSCGQCVHECPVAALEEAPMRYAGLPDKQVTTTCSYCAVGCSLKANVKDNRVISIEPDPQGSANRGHTCIKGRFAHQYTYAPDRLRTPLIRTPSGEFRQASWDEALDLVAGKLAEIRRQHGPAALATISSARCTNEENFIMQKFTRVALGTNSVDNCSRVCHSPSAYSLRVALGTGAGTNSFEDVEDSKLLLIVGANPTEAHPVFGARIKQAVLRGCKLVVIDPRNTELAKLADVHLPLRPGTNLAVVNALQHVIIAENLLDQDFIARHAEGLEEVRAEVASCTPEWAAELSGVDPQLIRQAARLYATSTASQVLWGLGVTEGGHGSMTAFGLINLAVMTGNIGRRGTGACPIRGQNNVQGASDMGALPDTFSDYRRVDDPEARADHARAWGVEPPVGLGLRIPDMMNAAHAGKLKAMYILAEDIAQSDPHTAHIVGALEKLDFLVVQDIFLCETAKLADVVLPGTTFLEKDGTFTNSDRRIQRIRRAAPPPPDVLTDGDVTNAIARRMGVDLGFDNGPGTPIDPERVMREIAHLTPNWAGVTYQRLEEMGFIQWPCYDETHPGTAIVHQDGHFLRGKAKLTATPWKPPGEMPDAEYPLVLTTGRQLYHYNAATMTRRTDVSRLDKAREESVRIHPQDARKLDIHDGELVAVVSRRGKVQVKAQVSESTNLGTVFMTFHYAETRTNILIGHAADEFTGCPEYKVTAVRIEKAAPQPSAS